MEKMIVKLSEPIQSGSEVITELIADRPLKAKDFRGLSTKLTFDDSLILVSRLFAQPAHVIDELQAKDMMVAMEVVNSFL